jgi:hypothetical protein
LIAARTQVAALQQTESYAPGWGTQFNAAMAATPGVRVAFATDSAVIYTLRWQPGARARPLSAGSAGHARQADPWDMPGLIVLWLLIALLGVREFVRIARPAARLIRPLTVASLPLLVLLAGVIALRFWTVS